MYEITWNFLEDCEGCPTLVVHFGSVYATPGDFLTIINNSPNDVIINPGARILFFLGTREEWNNING